MQSETSVCAVVLVCGDRTDVINRERQKERKRKKKRGCMCMITIRWWRVHCVWMWDEPASVGSGWFRHVDSSIALHYCCLLAALIIVNHRQYALTSSSSSSTSAISSKTYGQSLLSLARLTQCSTGQHVVRVMRAMGESTMYERPNLFLARRITLSVCVSVRDVSLYVQSCIRILSALTLFDRLILDLIASVVLLLWCAYGLIGHCSSLVLFLLSLFLSWASAYKCVNVICHDCWN